MEKIRIVMAVKEDSPTYEFVEIENENGESLNRGEWKNGEPGYEYIEMPDPAALETALAQEREKVGKLRKAATFARRGCEYNNMFAECEVLDEALSETAPDARSEKEADHD